MIESRRRFLVALAAPVAVAVVGCSGPDNPKLAEAPPFVPTEAEKAPAKGKPAGYGEGDVYKKMMNRSE